MTYLAIVDSTRFVEVEAPSVEDESTVGRDDDCSADFVLEARSLVYLRG